MAKTSTHPVDRAKLQNLIGKTGLTNKELSKQIGYSDDYIDGALKQEAIGAPAVRLLDLAFGIKYADYMPTKEEPKPPVKPEPGLNFEKVFKAVLQANETSDEILLHKFFNGIENEGGLQFYIYTGLRGFWIKHREDIRDVLAEAIKEALK